jgi:cytochrome bd-type quinol oxidase subunit 1
MIVLYLVFAGIALVVFACTSRMRRNLRMLTALLIFLIPSVGLTGWVVAVGDRAPPDAVTVQP